MKIFVAGCARSGTTLMIKLVSSYLDTVALADSENPFSFFGSVSTDARNIALKRDFESYKTLASLPEDIELIYMLRHPFDVLTSYHPDFPNRKYFVTEARWRAEFSALKALCAAQPERKVVYVEYSALVSDPDVVQVALAKRLGLEISRSFSEVVPQISTGSVSKFKQRPDLKRYLYWLPHDFRIEIKEYCDRFGFDLPTDYVVQSSRPRDAVRRFVIRQMARNWRHKLNPFAGH